MTAPPAMALPKTPSFRLEGRRALVTGGSKGIGLAAAAALAEAGAAVTILARRQAELEEAVAALRAAGGQAEGLALDVQDLAATAAALEAAAPFDILVNNAGTNRPKTFAEVTVDDYDVVMGLNVRAAFFVAQHVARRLIEAGRPGSIIHISSQMGHVGGLNRSLYCASKWAMEGMSKAMALDLAPHRIRVNCIAPTFIETELTRPFFADPKVTDWVMSKIKLGRIGQVEDLMGAVLYLAGDASALVTGTSLLVDGGWTAD
jgi:NAD(P)-dependent dehydrogenase (short-subunit alcohol dehydrogenase family)